MKEKTFREVLGTFRVQKVGYWHRLRERKKQREREGEGERDIEIREGRQEGKFRQLIVKKSEHHQEKENEEKKE